MLRHDLWVESFDYHGASMHCNHPVFCCFCTYAVCKEVLEEGPCFLTPQSSHFLWSTEFLTHSHLEMTTYPWRCTTALQPGGMSELWKALGVFQLAEHGVIVDNFEYQLTMRNGSRNYCTRCSLSYLIQRTLFL
jgi:hypothetical protein